MVEDDFGTGNQQLIGLAAPQYLFVQDHKKCLGSQKASGSSHTELCSFSAKPDICPQTSFDELQKPGVFSGVLCRDQVNTPLAHEEEVTIDADVDNAVPSGRNKLGGPSALPPIHLSIPNSKDCLETQPSASGGEEVCLPEFPTKPECTRATLIELRKKFTGNPCKPIAIADDFGTLGGVGGLKPLYLEVPYHEECLESQNSDNGGTEVCLPLVPPTGCAQKTYDQIKEVFNNPCQLTMVEDDFGTLGGHTKLGGPSALPPVHLTIPNAMDCLETQPSENGGEEVCLPSFPINPDCTMATFDALRDKFTGETCKPIAIADDFGTLGGLGGLPPAYLSIPNFEDCVGSIKADEGEHNEICLHMEAPTGCTEEAYNSLLEHIFGPASGGGFGSRDPVDQRPPFVNQRPPLQQRPDPPQTGGSFFVGDPSTILNEPNVISKRECDPDGNAGCSRAETCHSVGFSGSFCVPYNRPCTGKYENNCPKVGNLFNGQIGAVCNNGYCEYSNALIIT